MLGEVRRLISAAAGHRSSLLAPLHPPGFAQQPPHGLQSAGGRVRPGPQRCQCRASGAKQPPVVGWMSPRPPGAVRRADGTSVRPSRHGLGQPSQHCLSGLERETSRCPPPSRTMRSSRRARAWVYRGLRGKVRCSSHTPPVRAHRRPQCAASSCESGIFFYSSSKIFRVVMNVPSPPNMSRWRRRGVPADCLDGGERRGALSLHMTAVSAALDWACTLSLSLSLTCRSLETHEARGLLIERNRCHRTPPDLSRLAS